jgi:hypothetical protein
MDKKVKDIHITLNGLTDFMADRYPGDNKTSLPPERKLYLDGNKLILPAANISSFLSAQNTESAAKRFMGRGYKSVASALLSYTAISPQDIPFTAKGKPIIFEGFDDKRFYVHYSVARLAKGIPNPKARPVLRVPWELSFTLSLFPNKEVNEDLVRDLFVRGGLAIGLGTFRGVFGKFEVSKWE